jgi:hypothetical protein
MTDKQKEIAGNLFKNAAGLSFGTASVELRIHAGKCTGIIYTTSENTRQRENGDRAMK